MYWKEIAWLQARKTWTVAGFTLSNFVSVVYTVYVYKYTLSTASYSGVEVQQRSEIRPTIRVKLLNTYSAGAGLYLVNQFIDWLL